MEKRRVARLAFTRTRRAGRRIEGRRVDKKLWPGPGAVGLALLVIGALLALPTRRAEAANLTFGPGDVFVSLSNGSIQWRGPDGTLKGTLVNPTTNGYAEGMGFDVQGNLYAATWYGTGGLTGNTVALFTPAGVYSANFGSGYDCNPTSLDFDSTGNVYVGQADCSKVLLQFNAVGVLQNSYSLATEVRGSNWIDLAGDECTVFYTSEGPNVKRFNTCADAQLSDFTPAPLPGSTAYAIRILPDDTVLVADADLIVRLDGNGNVMQTYNTPMTLTENGHWWVGLDLDVDGTSFWASNRYTNNVWKFDIASANTLLSFNTNTPGVQCKGVKVNRPPSTVSRGGRMTGGGSIFTSFPPDTPGGIRVTHGFELHCNVNRKPNNLEINWDGGNQFHLENLTFANCTDDPTITPNPPNAPFDTYEGKGTGRFNRQPGFCAEWIFTDAGEPGINDRIKKLIIKDCSTGVPVLSVPGPNGHTLTYGNHQAHK